MSEPAVPSSEQPNIPAWFEKAQAVVNAVNELIDEDPDEVAAGIPLDWASALGDSSSGLATWLVGVQDAIAEAARVQP